MKKKHFFYETVKVEVRQYRGIAVVVAFLYITANLLSGDQTTHSSFILQLMRQ